MILLVELVLDLSHDLFHDVFQGHQPCDAAVFVEDNGDLRAPLSELAQQAAHALRLRDKERLPHHVAEGRLLRPGRGRQREQVLHVHDPHHIVAHALVDGDPAVKEVLHHTDGFGHGGPDLNGLHLHARRHDPVDFAVPELQNPFDHFLLVQVERTLTGGVLDGDPDLLFRCVNDLFIGCHGPTANAPTPGEQVQRRGHERGEP